MANIRHTVVIRRDLNLTPGLMAAQVAHISDAFMRKKIRDAKEFIVDEIDWMKNPYLSVVAVDNLEELNEVTKMAQDAGLPVHVWDDIIPSVNLNKPMPDVRIGISIGPADFDRIKAVTGTLPLA